ncbi:hypothetical protein EV191_1275 [Tamaricihabitans halophyticus]|uniref:Uncharacterized protein n=1 Tax=Tamaricihabitans halophyticus TaxID=1262583 RepID=A0A4R2PYE7_9PSEU|nr:hypothetical protein EV191_1275 [Tamaricihabitans halophyticus]
MAELRRAGRFRAVDRLPLDREAPERDPPDLLAVDFPDPDLPDPDLLVLDRDAPEPARVLVLPEVTVRLAMLPR